MRKMLINIVAKFIVGINLCFTLETVIFKFAQFLDSIIFQAMLDEQLTHTLDIGQTLDRHFLKLTPLIHIQYTHSYAIHAQTNIGRQTRPTETASGGQHHRPQTNGR